jgi:CubicO group peptidase (beta-lactamase class C family)
VTNSGRAASALFLVALVSACASQTPPVERSGTWSRIAPRLAGVDPQRLAAADRWARSHVPALTSLLVARRGQLVLERYYHLGRLDQPVPILSITKSVLSTLVGIALAEHRLKSLDLTVGDVLGSEIPTGADRRVRSITLRELLTMTAGFGSPTTDPFADGGNAFRTTPNWVRTILGSPLSRSPGAGFYYDNGDAHLVSTMLQHATGGSAATFARAHLFRPLQIVTPRWGADRQGVTDGAAGLWLRPRDLAKLGELYLRHGRWGTRQVVPASYVDAATRPQISTGIGAALEYGYLWWTYRGGRGMPALYLAIGSGGQLVIVIPSRDAVVVMTSDSSSISPPAEELELARRVLAAIRPN